jgi:hypothetical protein
MEMIQVADSLRLRLTEAGRVWLWLCVWSLEPGNVGKAGQARSGVQMLDLINFTS